jgi:hypothetical protein
MFWLDGSPSLPFPISSISFPRKAHVEHLAEALASIENQAKIAKSCVKTGNFDHWCHAASELVNLTNFLIYLDNSYLYYEGLISQDERLHYCSELSSQLVDLVSLSMFEHTRECLLANFKSTNLAEASISTQFPRCELLVNQRSLSGSTETSAQVTTLSLALPRHDTATTSTTPTPTSPLQHHPVLHGSTHNTNTQPRHTPTQIGTTPLPVASCDCKN